MGIFMVGRRRRVKCRIGGFGGRGEKRLRKCEDGELLQVSKIRQVIQDMLLHPTSVALKCVRCVVLKLSPKVLSSFDRLRLRPLQSKFPSDPFPENLPGHVTSKPLSSRSRSAEWLLRTLPPLLQLSPPRPQFLSAVASQRAAASSSVFSTTSPALLTISITSSYPSSTFSLSNFAFSAIFTPHPAR